VPRVLRTAALVAVLVGAAGSLALMLYAGRRNQSRILVILFALWVLAPFAALAWANFRGRLHALTPGVAAVSLAFYGAVASGVLRAKIGFIFLVVPAISLLVTGAISLKARLSARGTS